MGFNRQFPRAGILGSKKWHGKKMTNYAINQYTSNLGRLVDYISQDEDIGSLLRIQINQHQQLIG